ncbi:hypothetical protein [Tsukamurella strandjordii]|uniref:hypothetical protein n=1 Tax=Tsukamurella strandjordii TaxID=147577 RepID=UPI0031E137F4
MTAMYWAQRRPQLARMETVAMGYPADERGYYDREPRVTFRDTLIACSPEWRAAKAVA